MCPHLCDVLASDAPTLKHPAILQGENTYQQYTLDILVVPWSGHLYLLSPDNVGKQVWDVLDADLLASGDVALGHHADGVVAPVDQSELSIETKWPSRAQY